MPSATVERAVYVVDDDDAALDSLVVLLRGEGLNPKPFASAPALLAGLPDGARGCIVTDVRMPGMDGIELVRALREKGVTLPVVVVTGHADISVAVQAMKSGAVDFLEKPYEAELMLRTIRAAIEAHEETADAAAGRNRVLNRLEALTKREREVLDLIVQGASNKVVANTLDISPRTVEIYRANVMSKMRADNLAELVRMMLAAGAA